MGQTVNRIHSKEDDKIYNILPIGQMPTVVFGRRLREQSIPGMQYYFSDGRVKWKNGGDSFVKPFPKDGYDETARQWGVPCIFTVPEDYDWSKVSSGDYDYIKQHCRKADRLNANTMSPNYIVRNGEIVCVKTLGTEGRYVIVQTKKISTKHYRQQQGGAKLKTTSGKMINPNGLSVIEKLNESSRQYRNTITVIPVGRVRHKKKYQLRGTSVARTHCKKSIYHYNFRKTSLLGVYDDRDCGKWSFKLI